MPSLDWLFNSLRSAGTNVRLDFSLSWGKSGNPASSMGLFVATFDFNEESRDSILDLDKSHLNPKTFIAIYDYVTMLLLRYSAFYGKQ